MKEDLPERSLIIKNKLPFIVRAILAAAQNKIAKIILFGSYARGTWVKDMYVEGHITYSYESDLDLLVITKQNESSRTKLLNIDHKIEKQLEKKGLNDNPFITLVVESIVKVNKELEKGRYFFSDIKKEGILLYDSGDYQLSEARKLDPQERNQIATEDYDYWFNKGSAFLKHANYALRDIDYSTAAFFLHQATESFYNAVLLVFSGYKPKLHDITKLAGMINHYHNDLLKIFPMDTKEQKDNYELLRAGYIEARYNKNYKINQEQLSYLITRVSKLQKVTQEICRSKIF